MLSRWCSGKESAHPCRRLRSHRFDPWDRKIPWRRKWQPTPVFLPGKSHRQRSLVGCSPGSQRVGHDWEHSMRGLGRRKRNLENWRPDIIAKVFSIKPRKSWRQNKRIKTFMYFGEKMIQLWESQREITAHRSHSGLNYFTGIFWVVLGKRFGMATPDRWELSSLYWMLGLPRWC